MTRQVEMTLEPRRRGCHLITSEIMQKLGELPEAGLLNLFVRHTSCALSINENCDPDVRTDMAGALDRMVPESRTLYSHVEEGDDDMPSHVKSSVVGVSLTIPIVRGRLALGTWQGIYLCEFRNYGGARKIVATILT